MEEYKTEAEGYLRQVQKAYDAGELQKARDYYARAVELTPSILFADAPHSGRVRRGSADIRDLYQYLRAAYKEAKSERNR